MTTLLQHSQNLESKLSALAQAKLHERDLKLIQERTTEWANRNTALKAIRAKISPLKLGAEDSRKVANKEESLRKNAVKVLTRLKENVDINALTRDAGWTSLLKASEGLKEEFNVAGRDAWRTYLEQQAAPEDPTTLRQRTPLTPENQRALRAYEASYTSYSTITRLLLPRTSEDLDQLVTNIEGCRKEFERLSFDLPDDVLRFYRAISGGRAPLAYITPTVLKYLLDNGYSEQFEVRSSLR